MGLFDLIPDDYDSAFDLSTPIGRREFIRSTAFALIDEGISANQALQIYREVGAGIGNQAFRNIYREAGQYALEKRVQFIPHQAPLYDNLYGIGTRNTDAPYTYKGRILYKDRLSGETITANWLVDTDLQTSLADIQDIMADSFRQSATYFDSVIEGVEIFRAWTN